MTKVFCIGFQKTGTKSMAHALRVLGYQVTGPNRALIPKDSGMIEELLSGLLDRFDAFQDNPWPVLYEYLDCRHPGSRFILTVRDTESWLKSVVKHFGTRSTPMREWIYGEGSPSRHETTYRDRYERHNRSVVEYFKGRDSQLLIMELGRGDGWDKLCQFLGKNVPAQPFPRENSAETRNQTSEKYAKFKDVIRSARQVVGHGRRDLYNLARYGRLAPRKFELIYVNPSHINRYAANREIIELTGTDRNRASGMVVEWSRIGTVGSLYDQQKYMLCEKHWLAGLSWQQVGYYEFMAQTNKWGRHSRVEIAKRCDKLDTMFEETKVSGKLLTRSQLDPTNFREEGGILVHIGTEGEPVFGGHGFHRLAIAKILDLHSIPACVGVVDQGSLDRFGDYRKRRSG